MQGVHEQMQNKSFLATSVFILCFIFKNTSKFYNFIIYTINMILPG